PPAEEKRQLFMFRFTYRFDETEPFQTAYGLYGGIMTWSSFRKYETPPTPEQLYVHHCALETSRAPGLNEKEPLPVSPRQALDELRKTNPGQFTGEIPVDEKNE
ncbi:MAG: hypothetical protein HKN23_12450, partial [Verrucomicrobiales bacterium]|nr:hypothetical protein [Verrucomicrobiales bacterium]